MEEIKVTDPLSEKSSSRLEVLLERMHSAPAAAAVVVGGVRGGEGGDGRVIIPTERRRFPFLQPFSHQHPERVPG